jgi:hypothetical protein
VLEGRVALETVATLDRMTERVNLKTGEPVHDLEGGTLLTYVHGTGIGASRRFGARAADTLPAQVPSARKGCVKEIRSRSRTRRSEPRSMRF